MMKRVFITGTDTEVGKTKVGQLILNTLPKNSLNHGWKPIAAGCFRTQDGQLHNEDALTLKAASTTQLSYSEYNPIAFEPAIAPHIAAAQIGQTLSVKKIQRAYQNIPSSVEHLLIEGAGGWLLPLNKDETLADWVKEEKIPVVLVVGMKLGCLNHALLTWAQLTSTNIPCLGWIANSPVELRLDSSHELHSNRMEAYQANLDYLKQALPVPLLAEIPYLTSAQEEQWLEQHPHLGTLLFESL